MNGACYLGWRLFPEIIILGSLWRCVLTGVDPRQTTRQFVDIPPLVLDSDLVEEGKIVKRGDLLGHPSCEGGRATGTHVHIGRRYNGEWIPAGGPLPFILDGWVTAYGDGEYEGTLMKGSKVVPASSDAAAENQILYKLPE